MFELLLKELILKLETPQSWAVIVLFLLVWAIKSLWEWFIKEFRAHIADDENRQAKIDDKLIKIDEKLARIEEWTAMNAKQNEIIHASSVKVNEIILEKIKSL